MEKEVLIILLLHNNANMCSFSSLLRRRAGVPISKCKDGQTSTAYSNSSVGQRSFIIRLEEFAPTAGSTAGLSFVSHVLRAAAAVVPLDFHQ